MDGNFWHGKKVLITGHTGFKGSWLSLWLQSLGASISGYALPPTRPSLFELARAGEGLHSHIGDVRDLEHLQRVLAEEQSEVVFHLAAQPLVRYSYVNPVETYATNVMGTVHLLEAVRQSDNVRAVVIITSDKCYDNREWVWGYRESDPMGGHDPYSNSKGCAELVTAAYRVAFFNPAVSEHHGVAVASARAGNVIGGGDWSEDRLIPDVIRAFLDKQPVVIRHPHAIRPWQHVLEPLNGYLWLAQKLWQEGSAWAEAWNFGPNDEDAKPVEWVVERMSKLWGEGASWRLDDRSHPHEAHYLKLDISKARLRLGWQPRRNLESALKDTVDWYRAYQRKQDMREVALAQISAYGTTSSNELFAST